MAEISTQAVSADAIVKNYMLGSLAVGVLPLPFLDLAILSGLQLAMLRSISNVYNVEFSSNLGKAAIAALVGGALPVSLGSLLRPFYGQFAGFFATSLVGGASTYAVGKVFIQHFESGGTFLTFDPQKVREYYALQLEEGKKEVKSYAGVRP